MTYTLLGRCSRTGQLGIAVATYSLAVGAHVPLILPHAGMIATQAFGNPTLRAIGGPLLAAGYTAESVLAQLQAADAKIGFRQVAVMDRRGAGACWTGEHCRPWAGHEIAQDVIACGNVLVGPDVVTAMKEAFFATAELPLADQLLAGIEAGRDAGGQQGSAGHLPERSASLLVHADEAHPLVDLRVDLSDDAVGELRALHDTYRPYVAFRELRWRDPEQAPPQEKFVASLGGNAG
ncbi:DUF1028 domain-containing protein [Chelatococcus sp. GCM10030263]|uniref:DUF1028 domain-containing protein n=1 Tax=Chelatococcus sp. GCM10030263 TaxID=3273387 RepID=UPI0036111D9E